MRDTLEPGQKRGRYDDRTPGGKGNNRQANEGRGGPQDVGLMAMLGNSIGRQDPTRYVCPGVWITRERTRLLRMTGPVPGLFAGFVGATSGEFVPGFALSPTCGSLFGHRSVQVFGASLSPTSSFIVGGRNRSEMSGAIWAIWATWGESSFVSRRRWTVSREWTAQSSTLAVTRSHFPIC